MKFTSIITTAIITTSSTTDAFSVLQRPNTNKMVNVKTSRRSTKAASSTTTTTSLFDSQMFFATAEDKKAESSNEEEEGEELASIVGSNNELSLGSIYDRLGFQEEQIAIGIEPDQVLEWIGNRDDMIARFKKDNSGLKDEQAEKEVDKFMMDSEMVNRLIRYEQMRANGEIQPDMGPQFDWFTVLVGGYLVYVVSSIVKKSLDNRNTLPSMEVDGSGAVGGDAVGAVGAVQSAVEAVQSSVDVAQNTALEAVHGTVPDVLHSTISMAQHIL